jgi:tetratricopeptide (TPR) repeat protein
MAIYHLSVKPISRKGGRSATAASAYRAADGMCADFRGRIAALAGNTAESEKWFAQAIEVAPQLPQVYTDRGEAQVDRGELGGALTDATQAATLSPHDGDVWKLWGDVLAKQGKTKDALAKYDEALKYAPHWRQLQDAGEAVVKQKT